MDEKEMSEFSWSGLFLVTGICSFIFGALMKMLDGVSPPIFLITGVGAFFLWIVHGFAKAISQITASQANKKAKDKRLAS